MSTFTVNVRVVTVEKNQKLIVYLRDALRLTSVKNGCSEGACGTCMDARGITSELLIEGANRSTMAQLTEWTAVADKVLVF